MTQILIVSDKYSTVYYDASTPAKLEAAARETLGHLLADHSIREDDSDPWLSDEDQELLALEPASVVSLPELMRKQVDRVHLNLIQRQRAQAENNAEVDMVTKLLADEEVWYTFRKKRKYKEETWNEILEAYAKANSGERGAWRGEFRLTEEGDIEKRVTAWRLLQDRQDQGYEYESYVLEELTVAGGE